MSTVIVTAAEGASSLKYWIDVATLAASATAPLAMTVALLQYISINRASARAHMHAVFRDYLAMRSTVPADKQSCVIGYRYYAMEEAYFWIIHQRKFWNPATWISKDEKAAWIETIKHHIVPDKGGEGHRYFVENRNIFGLAFQEFCDKELGALPAPQPPSLPADGESSSATG